MDYDIPKNITQCREKLREEFMKHKDVTDIRVIDMLIIKVYILLQYLYLCAKNVSTNVMVYGQKCTIKF